MRKFSKAATFIASAAALALTLSACGGKSSSNSGSGTLTLGVVSDPKAFDPLHTTHPPVTDLMRDLAVYDALFVIDNTTGKVTPRIGESVSTADNGTTWTIKLKPNIKFSDGTPFDAAAVKANWDAMANPASQSYYIQDAAVLKTTVVDPLTLQVALPTPNLNWDKELALNLSYIESPKALASDPGGTKPVGAGPYTLQSWVRNSQMTLKVNPTYYGPKPKFATVVIKVIPDVQQLIDAVKTGQVDSGFTIDSKKIQYAQQNKLQVTPVTLDGGQMIAFNEKQAPFDDPRARKAVALALDAANIDNTSYDGTAPVATNLFNTNSPFYDPTATQPASDKAQAQALFDQLAAEGKPVKFTYTSPDNPASNPVAELTQTILNGYNNVHVDLDKEPVQLYTVKMQVQRNYQAALYQVWASDPEPVFYNLFDSNGPTNFLGYSSPAADAALQAGRMSTDPAVRKQAYSDFQKAEVADLPVWVYEQAVTATVSRSNLKGITPVQDGGFLLDQVHN